MEKETIWQDSAKLYQRLNPSKSEFEVILFGLDGGIKLRSEVPVKCEDLFGVIDQMPMRKAEMNRFRVVLHDGIGCSHLTEMLRDSQACANLPPGKWEQRLIHREALF